LVYGERVARFLPKDFTPEKLHIELVEEYPGTVDVFYIPDRIELELAGLESGEPSQYKKKIATFFGQHEIVSIFPIITLPTHIDYLKPKYSQIEEITVEVDFDTAPSTKAEVIDCLQRLPSGFIKDLSYGLGLMKEFKPIILAIEEQTKHKAIWIGCEDKNNTDSECFYLQLSDFDEMRRVCNRVTERARKVARITKKSLTYNHIASLLGNKQKSLPTNIDDISKMLRIKISNTDKQAAMNLVVEDNSVVEQTDTVTLTKLKNDIELVSLERLISVYEELLTTKTKEDTWQKLFNENPFILSLTFGYPAIKISDQACVGGKKLSGDGDKITDYLIRNGVTNNLALIEIKKPSSTLLNKKPYRGAVYSASTELTGSVTQVLDQCYQLQQNIATIKNNNRMYDIESYAVHCILVIGTMPIDDDEQKSLEIYRRNSKNVQIITFDELLLKVKQLHDFLSENKSKAPES
jgi:hypothetical protein